MKPSKELTRGCVVKMKASSGMVGYGNSQCISWVSHELGELSLYGHNEHYKAYDVEEVIEYPAEPQHLFSQSEEGFNSHALTSDFSTPTINSNGIRERYEYQVTLSYSEPKELSKEKIKALQELILRMDKEIKNVINS